MARSSQERPSASISTDAATGFDQTLDGSEQLPTMPDRPVVMVHATRLGRFSLLHQLGEGGMGSVFAAYDQQLDRRVALKLLHQRTAANTEQRQRTLQEARAAARISHPNVVSVYEVGETHEHIYIAMEYVDGETLSAWQTHADRSWREILDMYLLAGAGLQAAHAVGVVHRDFKPDNVLCGKDGRLRVADFGLARIDAASQQPAPAQLDSPPPADVNRDGSGRLTQQGVISGTPGYMSPEQYRGGNVDARSDQWSFCAALFEALYGHLPYDGETLHELAKKVSGPPLPPPRNTKVPEEVHRALLRGLSAEPSQRFPSMVELLSALALEQGDHAAGRTLSRNRLLRWFVGVGISGFVLLQARQAQRSLNPRDMFFAAGLLFVATVAIGVLYRKTLLDNRFHRSMWFVCVLNMAENATQRLVAIKLGMPMSWLFPFEMIVLAANAGIIGAFLMPWFRWLPALPLAAAAASILDLASLRVLTFIYFLVLILLAVGWTRAARQPQHAMQPGDSGTLPFSRNRRTPRSPALS